MNNDTIIHLYVYKTTLLYVHISDILYETTGKDTFFKNKLLNNILFHFINISYHALTNRYAPASNPSANISDGIEDE